MKWIKFEDALPANGMFILLRNDDSISIERWPIREDEFRVAFDDFHMSWTAYEPFAWMPITVLNQCDDFEEIPLSLKEAISSYDSLTPEQSEEWYIDYKGGYDCKMFIKIRREIEEELKSMVKNQGKNE